MECATDTCTRSNAFLIIYEIFLAAFVVFQMSLVSERPGMSHTPSKKTIADVPSQSIIVRLNDCLANCLNAKKKYADLFVQSILHVLWFCA